MSWLIALDIWRRREKIRQASETSLMESAMFRCLIRYSRQEIAHALAFVVPCLLIFTILAC